MSTYKALTFATLESPRIAPSTTEMIGRSFINLDHPQFKAALGTGTIEDLTFRRLAYEVAFSEYALALALELAQRDEYIDVTDPIVDIGETINRVARRAASLYEVS